MFSMLVFMCRDPGDTTSKVSCCVESSYCFKNSDFDAIANLPLALSLKMSLTQNENTVNLKSDSFFVIIVLHEGLVNMEVNAKYTLVVVRDVKLRDVNISSQQLGLKSLSKVI